MRTSVLSVLVLLAATQASPAQPPRAEVNQAEVLRLGDLVHYSGAGPRANADDDAYLAAMAPPASDADKWFISVVTMKGCPGCEQLKKDWSKSQWLLALANPADPKDSWAQFNYYDKDDQSQAFRFVGIKITSYPTILVQPPRSGKYGPAATVVFQGTYGGDAEKLAREITQAIRRYVAKLPIPDRPIRAEGTGEKLVGVDPPWQPTPRVDPFAPQPTPAPVFPAVDPQIPPQPPVAPGSGFPWSTLLTLLAGGVTFPAAVGLTIWGFQVVRNLRQAEGKKLLLNQAAFDELMTLLRELAQLQTPPKNPPVTPTN